MTTFRSAISMAAFGLALAGCHHGGSAQTTTPPPTVPLQTFSEAVAQAEENGSIPVLNRDGTLAGPDADHNGIRDDIDQYINSLPDTPEQKSALRQTAATFQRVLSTPSVDRATARLIMDQLAASSNCAAIRYGAHVAGLKGKTLEKLTFNTKARVLAYGSFSEALNGSSFALPEGNSCVD